MRAFLKRQSLRTWLAVGMAIAVLPVVISVAIGYVTYHRTIVAPFREVLVQQHQVMLPLEQIQGDLWTLAAAVDDYAEAGDTAYRTTFQAAEQHIGLQLDKLAAASRGYDDFSPVVAEAQEGWTALKTAAEAVKPGDPATADQALLQFETVITDVAARLEQMLDEIRQRNEDSHRDMLAAMRRIEIGATVALVLTLLFGAAGVQIIDRALVLSTDELVAGAMRVADGDRKRKIDVQVPPELAAVANAFNVMTSRIVEQEARLSAMAGTDGLTGLANRREFDRALADEIAAARETGAPFTLLMVDIDHFKRFNDIHGHLTGDAVLRQVAQVLDSQGRSGDRAFRYGGEEFAMILPGLPAEVAERFAERIRGAVESAGAVLEDGTRLPLTVSIGVATCPGETPEGELIARADRALYGAKEAGRNRVSTAG